MAKREMDRLVSGSFQIVVDTVAARDNIIRLAMNQKWTLSVAQHGDEFLLTLNK
jgi:hypothetical protein